MGGYQIRHERHANHCRPPTLARNFSRDHGTQEPDYSRKGVISVAGVKKQNFGCLETVPFAQHTTTTSAQIAHLHVILSRPSTKVSLWLLASSQHPTSMAFHRFRLHQVHRAIPPTLRPVRPTTGTDGHRVEHEDKPLPAIPTDLVFKPRWNVPPFIHCFRLMDRAPPGQSSSQEHRTQVQSGHPLYTRAGGGSCRGNRASTRCCQLCNIGHDVCLESDRPDGQTVRCRAESRTG